MFNVIVNAQVTTSVRLVISWLASSLENDTFACIILSGDRLTRCVQRCTDKRPPDKRPPGQKATIVEIL